MFDLKLKFQYVTIATLDIMFMLSMACEIFEVILVRICLYFILYDGFLKRTEIEHFQFNYLSAKKQTTKLT